MGSGVVRMGKVEEKGARRYGGRELEWWRDGWE